MLFVCFCLCLFVCRWRWRWRWRRSWSWKWKWNGNADGDGNGKEFGWRRREGERKSERCLEAVVCHDGPWNSTRLYPAALPTALHRLSPPLDMNSGLVHRVHTSRLCTPLDMENEWKRGRCHRLKQHTVETQKLCEPGFKHQYSRFFLLWEKGTWSVWSTNRRENCIIKHLACVAHHQSLQRKLHQQLIFGMCGLRQPQQMTLSHQTHIMMVWVSAVCGRAIARCAWLYDMRPLHAVERLHILCLALLWYDCAWFCLL